MSIKNIFLSIVSLIILIGCNKNGFSSDKNPKWVNEERNSGDNDGDESVFYFNPPGAFIGDVMPFFDPVSKKFQILYLQDYRPNPSETFHPIWGLTTTDCTVYEKKGELIPYGEKTDLDAAIGTGSTVYDENACLYYTYYTGHTRNGEVVMLATSPDFKTWTKIPSFVLRGKTSGYSERDFRDPFVFKTDDGVYHMIVSTIASGRGVLVEYISKDLLNWEHQGIFMTMMWDRFYECPDIFRMGDWWYLIYSEKHAVIRRVQYFKAKSLEELRLVTLNDQAKWPDDHEGFLDSRGFYAAKTASDGINRYIWGWCPTRRNRNNTEVGAAPAEPEWAGTLVAHKLIQHKDGSLTLGPIASIENKLKTSEALTINSQSSSGVIAENKDGFKLMGSSFVEFMPLHLQNYISMTIVTSSRTDKFGISFCRNVESDKYYSVIVNPENMGTQRKIIFCEEGPSGQGYIPGIDSYVFLPPSDNVYRIKVFTSGSVCVVYINDSVAYTNRIYGLENNSWSINNYGGSIEVKNIKVLTN